MSDTPETNAAEERCIATGFKIGCVDVEFALQQERELNKIKAKCANQAERIRQLEGATNHAGGTPLSQWRSCAERLADWIRGRASFDESAVDALAEFERMKEINK